MKADLSKEDLINLVKGVSPKSMSECDAYTKTGHMVFTGNQWNEDWSWVQSKLESMGEQELFELYIKHK